MTMIKTKQESSNTFSWGGLHPLFHNPFISYLTPLDLRGKTILDCGCGKGINGYILRVTKDLTNSTLIGLDADEGYLSFVKKHNIYDKLAKRLVPPIPLKDKSVDFLICTEVIEHLTKPAGKKLLKEIERVCKGRALITTPNVFFLNKKNNFIDEHHSAWSTHDFKSFGYKVYGIGARVPVYMNDPLMKVKHALSYVLTPVSYVFPQLSGSLICVQDF